MPSALVSDTTLVTRARGGDRAAFARLVQRHRSLAWSLARRLLAEDGLADDAVQDAVLQAFLNLDLLRRPERFGPWLAGIALNYARRQLRVHARNGSLDDFIGGGLCLEPIDPTPGPEEQAEAADLSRRVRAAVDDLPVHQRAAVLLVYLSGLSPAEAAATLHIAPGALRARLYKARNALREQLPCLWQEELPMSTDLAYVEATVADVLYVPAKTDGAEGRSVIVLRSADGARTLQIWVGGFERDNLALALGSVPIQRPLTYYFTANLLAAAGATLQEIRVSRLVDNTFFAETVLRTTGGQVHVVDARASDAITLAVTAGVPIKVASEVFDQAQAWRTAYARDERPDAKHLPDILTSLKERLDAQQRDFEAELAARRIDRPPPRNA